MMMFAEDEEENMGLCKEKRGSSGTKAALETHRVQKKIVVL